MNTFLKNLRVRATEGYIRKIILPESKDERVLEAAKILIKENIAEPIFVCSREDAPKIKSLGFACVEIEEKRVDTLAKLLMELRASKLGTKDELTAEAAHCLARDPLMYGMYLLRMGEGDGLVAGATCASADVL